MKILLLDNYDSFTYNLLHAVKELGATDIEVVRNDQIGLDNVERFDKIILSPGPGIPEEAGLLLPIIKKYAATKSILGVCLGHQAIGEAFGARLENLKEVYHGVQTPVSILRQDVLFEGLGKEIPVGRYHSWVVSREDFPDCLEITAESREGQIMALRHKTYDVHGIQFHPESAQQFQGNLAVKLIILNEEDLASGEIQWFRIRLSRLLFQPHQFRIRPHQFLPYPAPVHAVNHPGPA